MVNEIEQYWNDLQALYELDKQQVKETEAGSAILFSREIQEDNQIKKRYCEVYEALVKFPKNKRYAVIAHQLYPNLRACEEYNKITAQHLDPINFSIMVARYYEQLAKHATKISEGIRNRNFEEEEVLKAFAETATIRGTAKVLGVSTNTLHKIMDNLGLPKDAEKLQAIIRKKVKKSFKWKHPECIFKKNLPVPEVSEKELINGIIEYKSIHQYALHKGLNRTMVERWLEYYGYPARSKELERYITKYIDSTFAFRFKEVELPSKEVFIQTLIETQSMKETKKKLGLNAYRFNSICLQNGIPTRVEKIAEYIRANYDKDFKIVKVINTHKTVLV